VRPRQFKHIATTGGFVRWIESGIVERIRLSQRGDFIASSVLNPGWHYISPLKVYLCVAVGHTASSLPKERHISERTRVVSHLELCNVGRNRGMVQWVRSGLIEIVRLSHKGDRLFARSLWDTKEHFIHPRRTHPCFVVSQQTLLNGGDLMRNYPGL
jgi:hypothetical protein